MAPWFCCSFSTSRNANMRVWRANSDRHTCGGGARWWGSGWGWGFHSSAGGAAESSRAWPPHRPREDELTHPADTSRSDLAVPSALLLRWRLSKPTLCQRLSMQALRKRVSALTWRYSACVMTSMRSLTRSVTLSAWSEFSMQFSKSVRNHASEYWYMGSTCKRERPRVREQGAERERERGRERARERRRVRGREGEREGERDEE
jgi:hypothetical protein